MAEFLRIWGPRELQDNWRNNAGNSSSMSEDGLDEVSELLIANNPRYDPRTYLNKYPQILQLLIVLPCSATMRIFVLDLYIGRNLVKIYLQNEGLMIYWN